MSGGKSGRERQECDDAEDEDSADEIEEDRERAGVLLSAEEVVEFTDGQPPSEEVDARVVGYWVTGTSLLVDK